MTSKNRLESLIRMCSQVKRMYNDPNQGRNAIPENHGNRTLFKCPYLTDEIYGEVYCQFAYKFNMGRNWYCQTNK